MQADESTTKLKPQEFNELLKHVNLVDVFLSKLRVGLRSRQLTERGQFKVSEKTEIASRDESHVEIKVGYRLSAKSGRSRLFDLDATYTAVFSTSKPIPAEFFEVFNEISLPLQTFPYFRELVNSIVSRMGLPPLILPLRKYLTGRTD